MPGEGRGGSYAFRWRGQSSGIASDWIKIDSQKSYQLSGWFKAGAGSFTGLIFGVVMADENQRGIKHLNVFSVRGSQTELTAACRTGDRILYLRDASKWQAGKLFAAAFGAAENQLTFNVAPLGVESVRQLEDCWEVGLAQPCGADLAAGSFVMENRAGSGGIFLKGAVNAKIPPEWTELKGRIESDQWWQGAAYAQVVVIGPGLRRGVVETPLLLDDFVFKAADDLQALP